MKLDLRLIKTLVEQISDERDIPKEIVFEALKEALASAYKKENNLKGHKVKIDFDPEKGIKRIYEVKIVKDDNEKIKPEKEIPLSQAKKIKKDVKPGDTIEFDLPLKFEFGRIASQTARQVIVQKIKEMEKNYFFELYKKKEGEILYARVQRIDSSGNVHLEIDKVLGIIPKEELIKTEKLKIGQRIRAYLYEVAKDKRGIVLYLSRKRNEFLNRLFYDEIPEINQGIVEIKSLVRDPGRRAKIAVYSNDPKIDPIGACVGQKGTRISLILNELTGENIDIIKWDKNPEKFIQNALAPAKVIEVKIEKSKKKATAFLTKDQLSLAIGKDGQNVKLASRLTGYDIDIKEIKE